MTTWGRFSKALEHHAPYPPLAEGMRFERIHLLRGLAAFQTAGVTVSLAFRILETTLRFELRK